MIANGQDESLVILAEECSEVVKAASKIHRCGADSNNKGRNSLTNLEELIFELGDLQAMIDIVIDQFSIDRSAIINGSQLKKNKLKTYSRHLQQYGRLEN